MSMGCDLHVHSVYSDGLLDPFEILDLARSWGLGYLSITDHDCYEGSLLLLGKSGRDLVILPGAELDVAEDVELLLYGVPNERLLELTRRICQERRDVARRMVEAIRVATGDTGLHFEQDIAARARGSIMKPHIARLCVQRNLADNFLDFKKKLHNDWMPQGVPMHQKPAMTDLVSWAREAGCKVILAHPLYYLLPRIGGKRYTSVEELLLMDVDGYEYYYDYKDQGKEHEDLLLELNRAMETHAKEGGLLLTGGSDFHQPGETLSLEKVPDLCGRTIQEALLGNLT